MTGAAVISKPIWSGIAATTGCTRVVSVPLARAAQGADSEEEVSQQPGSAGRALAGAVGAVSWLIGRLQGQAAAETGPVQQAKAASSGWASKVAATARAASFAVEAKNPLPC